MGKTRKEYDAFKNGLERGYFILGLNMSVRSDLKKEIIDEQFAQFMAIKENGGK